MQEVTICRAGRTGTVKQRENSGCITSWSPEVEFSGKHIVARMILLKMKREMSDAVLDILMLFFPGELALEKPGLAC